MNAVQICDSTLRDGSHAQGHAYAVTEVRAIARALDGAGVAMVEVAHGDGLGGSSFNYGFSAVPELELVEAAAEELERARLAVLLLPGIGTKDDLSQVARVGASAARVATHCTEADIAPQHIALARELDMMAVGFLMMAHMTSAPKLADQAAIMAEAGAQVVYVTDSAGALLTSEVYERVSALRQRLPDDVEVGFHGHRNLELAVANSLAAVQAGATWIDCCTCGLGAGAGNTPTEVFAAVCDRSGIQTGVDPFAAMDAGEDVVRPLMLRRQVVDRSALLLGYAGVYSSFLLHAERAAEQFGVSAKEILLELGRRKAVGGQEDWIIDIAADLATART